MAGFGLTKSVSRLVALLLTTHADTIDDEDVPRIQSQSAAGGELQLIFRDRGLLTVTSGWASFEGSFPEDAGPGTGWAFKPVEWAVDLLMSIMTIQKANVLALNFEKTWVLSEQSSTESLVAYFGLSRTLGGLFAASEDFQIRGDTTVELPDLFPVECEVLAGRLVNVADPDDVGIQIKHRSPDNRGSSGAPVNFTRNTVDQFFTVSPQLMERQLAQFFPIRGAT